MVSTKGIFIALGLIQFIRKWRTLNLIIVADASFWSNLGTPRHPCRTAFHRHAINKAKSRNENNDNNESAIDLKSSLKLPILFENEYMAVVNKPPLVPCHWPDFYDQRTKKKKRRRSPSLSTKRKQDDSDFILPIIERAYSTFPHREHIHLVHRLDAQTSGCLVLAFSSQVTNILSKALASSTESQKTYYAICRGNGQSLQARCIENLNYFIADGDVKDAKGMMRSAQTKIYPLLGSDNAAAKAQRCCLVRADPKTGRYHQIRQHLARVNYPIVGETRHHPDRNENRVWKRLLSNEKDGEDGKGPSQQLRLCLHCHRIQLISSSTSTPEATTTTTTSAISDSGNNDANDNSSIATQQGLDLKSILPPNGELDVSCPFPGDIQNIVEMTDWNQEARTQFPELFSAENAKVAL